MKPHFVLTRDSDGRWHPNGGWVWFASVQDAVDVIVEKMNVTEFYLEVIP